MYVKRHLSFAVIYFYTWRLTLISALTGTVAYLAYDYLGWKWVAIPWLPVSLIGIAVAFYVGFKNNQSYGRTWEARIIWGSITNLSRSFAAAVRAYVNNDHSAGSPFEQQRVDNEVRVILYRHIAWLYAMKHAMHQRTTWEHHDKASERQRKALRQHEDSLEEMQPFLSPEEMQWVVKKKNMATQLLDRQSQHIAQLRRDGLIDDFRHVELQKTISDMYNEQGRSERIKNTPFPRQYATSSTIFIMIFTIMLPFGLLAEFKKLGDEMQWLLIPFNLVVTWVFLLMEYTGDVSENPFEGLLNDVPLRTIVRNVEIDIKDMLGEDELPEKIPMHYGSLF
ncbi:MAG: hypothetical protein EOP51_03370 [Sphingobacteriales bacterium]|nr:MAG: hypothetical protein EOP51_03370 [Sphingobacteriales bacterium]